MAKAKEMNMSETRGKTTRSPIVVVMGHIDHGKTTILDWYRKSKVAATEAGGITQHIGAYKVEHKGKEITFIDTPGHEAFSKIRSRGARVADLAVLVVAADEGVKPQTREALRIIREEKIPFVVALNKIDKPEANPERIKQELAKEEVLVESYGGQVPSVEISAREGRNMDGLLEMISLVAELEDLEAHPDTPASGVVIEAHLDSRRGITATLLVQDGAFGKKDTLVIGRAIETMKILEDFQGSPIESAGPSSPVRAVGLSSMPAVGDEFRSCRTKTEAEALLRSLPAAAAQEKPPREEKGARPIFNIILKADVGGSKEALEESIKKFESDALGINILWAGIGDITESDVKRALATRLVTIVGFKVKIDGSARELAASANIRIVTGEIIYDLLDEVKKAAADILPPEILRTVLGRIKILKVFKREGNKQIIGGRAEEGVIKRGARIEIRRGRETVIGGGIITQLQREKNPVEEVKSGAECGLLVEMKAPIQEGDSGEVYEEEVIKKTL